ncbi:amidohydrolase family protein [Verrucomicrobium spinosum]|uniref:amidohydrolase family protein n=1 Tax=Verrucomicrobium spinosum TaxID=2736 RepID=UPI000AE3CCF9|nr:amidohydrolase family protein [Verrucomicrobium spinosum]
MLGPDCRSRVDPPSCRVLTVDPAFSIREALAVDATGRIIACGGNQEVLALKETSTQLIDLAGKTLMPGLMDSHVHPGAALTEYDHEIPVMETIQDVLNYIAARAKATPEVRGSTSGRSSSPG